MKLLRTLYEDAVFIFWGRRALAKWYESCPAYWPAHWKKEVV
jgi:hypothetical protein